MATTALPTPERLLLAAPRGYCAGVDRAVQTVERALELYGAPVYVRKEIVHNKHVVAQLRERGAIFVEELDDTIPEGATTVFSAHGVSPAVHADAKQRNLFTLDATCPLVTKVHVEAKKFAAEGYTIVLIGHAGHEEVEGTMGEAPEHIVLVETEADVDALEVGDPERIAYISQTTLSVDETRTIINRLREKFPSITGPRTDDICYATTNRQAAVKQMASECDLVLVIGSQNSSNSQRLVDVARDLGAEAHLIDNEAQVRDEWLEGARVVGITSGASAPEELVQRLVAFFRDRGTEDVSEFEVMREDVRFMLPKTVRQAIAGGGERVALVALAGGAPARSVNGGCEVGRWAARGLTACAHRRWVARTRLVAVIGPRPDLAMTTLRGRTDSTRLLSSRRAPRASRATPARRSTFAPIAYRERSSPQPRPDLVAVLVEARRAAAQRADRRAGERDAVGLEDRLEPERLGERVGLGHVVDRADRDVGGAQDLDPVVGRLRAEDRLERLAERVEVGDARRVGGEALVARQLRQPDRLAQPREQAVVADRDGERAVGRLVGLVGRDARVAVAAARGLGARRHPARALVEQRGQHRVQQRDLDVAAGARALALDQRRLDPRHREQPADEVHDRRADLQRRARRPRR